MDNQQHAQAAEIAKINDATRRMQRPGRLLVTRGVADRPYFEEVLAAVVAFDDFTEANDPYGEHDFGRFMLRGETFLWKIDYTDGAKGYWRDPLDPACVRVLTIMLASEY